MSLTKEDMQMANPNAETSAKRYIFIRDTGRVVFESDYLVTWVPFAAKRGFQFVQDRETATRYEVLASGPMIERLRRVA